MPITRKIPVRESTSIKCQQGFNLVEIMVSVVISAFALLGLAGLQLSSVNTTNVAYAQSQSMMVINELVDQMRSNTDAAKNGDFDIDATTEGALQSFSDLGAAPAASAPEVTKMRYYWFQNVDRTLPGAKAAVKCFNTGLCAILVQYNNVDSDKQSTETTLEQIISVQL